MVTKKLQRKIFPLTILCPGLMWRTMNFGISIPPKAKSTAVRATIFRTGICILKSYADWNMNNIEIRGRMYRQGLSLAKFSAALEEVVMPVYQSAKNCGFLNWVYAKGEADAQEIN